MLYSRTVTALRAVLLTLVVIFCLAAASAPTNTPIPPTETTTPAPTATVSATLSVPEVAGRCAELKFSDCFSGAANYGTVTIIGIVTLAVIVIIGYAFISGIGETAKDWGRAFAAWVSTLLRRGSDSYYLGHFITDFTDPKYQPFTGDEVKDKPTLEKVYLSLSLRPEALGDSDDRKTDDKAAGLERAVGRFPAGRVKLAEAFRQSKKNLALIGGAGSGKSTFLQWAGLACAKDYARRRLDRSQREFVWALSKAGRSLRVFRIRRWLLLTRPLFPIFIPLGEFDQFCGNPRDPQWPEKKMDGPLPPNAETLLMFACWRFNRAHPEHKQAVTPGYLKRKLRGALWCSAMAWMRWSLNVARRSAERCRAFFTKSMSRRSLECCSRHVRPAIRASGSGGGWTRLAISIGCAA